VTRCPAGSVISQNLYLDFFALTGLRPPFKGFRVDDLLKGIEVIGSVCTVNDRQPSPRDRAEYKANGKKCPKRIAFPPELQYSRIEALHRITSGTPKVPKGRRNVRRS
jgi:hypothetical protein